MKFWMSVDEEEEERERKKKNMKSARIKSSSREEGKRKRGKKARKDRWRGWSPPACPDQTSRKLVCDADWTVLPD